MTTHKLLAYSASILFLVGCNSNNEIIPPVNLHETPSFYGAITELNHLNETFLVLVPPKDYNDFSKDEEGYLRKLGVILDGQPFNGIINLDTGPMPKESAKAYTYRHVNGGPLGDGPCACKYTRTCWDASFSNVSEIISVASVNGEGGGVALPIDYEFEFIISPNSIKEFQQNQEKVLRSFKVIPDTFQINGVLPPVFDMNQWDNLRWHKAKYYHVGEGKCKSKWVLIDKKKVYAPQNLKINLSAM